MDFAVSVVASLVVVYPFLGNRGYGGVCDDGGELIWSDVGGGYLEELLTFSLWRWR